MKLRAESVVAVVDWNFIQTNCYRTDLPSNYQCLLSDAIGLEIVGKETNEAFVDACARFAFWLQKNSQRVWISRPVGQLIAQQVKNATCLRSGTIPRIRRDDLIDWRRTRRLRQVAIAPCFDWQDHFCTRDSRPVTQYELGRAELTQIARDIALEPRLVASLIASKGDGEIVDAVRAMDLSDLLAQEYSPPTRQRIRGQMAASSSRFVQVRCARIKLYYAMIRARSPVLGDENSWDDLQYAVLSSYTGHLATFDGGLRECVRHLFPAVRLIPSAL